MKNIFDKSEWMDLLTELYNKSIHGYDSVVCHDMDVSRVAVANIKNIFRDIGFPIDLVWNYYYRNTVYNIYDIPYMQVYDTLFNAEPDYLPISECNRIYFLHEDNATRNKATMVIRGSTGNITIQNADCSIIKIPIPKGTTVFYPNSKLDVKYDASPEKLFESFLTKRSRILPIALETRYPGFGAMFTDMVTMLKYSQAEDLVLLGFDDLRDKVSRVILDEVKDYAMHNACNSSDFYNVHTSMEVAINTMINILVGTPDLIKYKAGIYSSKRNLFMKFTVTRTEQSITEI